MSAVITSEFATTYRRGGLVAAVFAMQGFGILTASLVACLTLLATQSLIMQDGVVVLDLVWRICVGVGLIPSLVSVYFRFTMPETPEYTKQHAKDAATATPQKASWGEFARYFRPWRRLKILLGTCIAWFALDVAFYGLNLNNAIILTAIGFSNQGTPYDQLFSNAVGNIIIALLGTVPGYWVSVFTIDRLGRKKIQIGGFALLTLLYLILGVAYQPILNTSVYLFITLFTLAQFFTNFGPNCTTFVIPGEVFPTRVRSTAHGVSAASGKLGAIVAQVGFSQLVNIGGKGMFVDKLMIIFAVFTLIGGIVTFWIPETARKPLDVIEREIDGDATVIGLSPKEIEDQRIQSYVNIF